MAAILTVAGSAAFGGRTVYAKDNGYIYCVGSVSKVYVTAAAMRLADEGKLDIDAPVTDYIPEFTMADERYKDITLRMLMDHTSGIMGTTMPGAFLYNDNNMLHHDTLLAELSVQRLKADPGAYASYCNDGFDLLELVVERVSGLSYTDYVEQFIAKPAGCKNTGTAVDMLKNVKLVPAVSSKGVSYEPDMTLNIGAGGIFATAEDAADFGSMFFKGTGKVLSEEAKTAMAKKWTEDKDAYLDKNGLGWDIVSLPKYEDCGVSVQYKGGDTGLDHAFLLTAPEEEISVAVLTNGGTSYYNGMMAQALLDVVLADRGIEVREETEQALKTTDHIPESYDAYEGFYGVQNDLSGGAAISHVTFPDHRYMHVENHTAARTTEQDFLLCEDGTFAELAFEIENGDLSSAKPAANPAIVSFVEKDGTVYLAQHNTEIAPGLGRFERVSYAGQKMEENPVSAQVLAKWSALTGKDFLLCNDLYSSQAYTTGITRVYLSDVLQGYIYAVTPMGSRLLKIVDEDHAAAPFDVPSSINRDLIDIVIERGTDGDIFSLSNGMKYISNDALQELTAGGTFKPGDREPVWYRIGDEIANRTLRVTERPEGSAVIVYNKYGEPVYNSHIVDAGDDLPLPKEGYIVITGKTGESVVLE
ncbi:MAG: beta-lactamase family protein [Lachnospiraceae bacterium]|nr:beta-lactamase family protein [Lachnospiraceae bacterium]